MTITQSRVKRACPFVKCMASSLSLRKRLCATMRLPKNLPLTTAGYVNCSKWNTKGIMKIGPKIFFLAFLVTVFMVLLLTSRITRPISGVIEVKLVAGCQVEFYDIHTQPVFTTVLACPRVDSIRLWPLPFLQPWYEEPIFPAGSKEANVGIRMPG
jgi:hypothetical protein